MLTITRRRLKGNRRGISNVIVIVLSLVIILAIVSNIILWSYEMNQHDWEKLKEEARITSVECVTCSSWVGAQSEYTVNTGILVNGTYVNTQIADGVFERFREASVLPYSPSAYSLGGSTSWISGSVADLESNDEVYMTFRSYSTGTDTSDFVDNNTSNIDSSADKGTHGNFSAQQTGPDSVYDTLTEGSSGASSNSTLLDDGFEDFIWDANWDSIPSNWRENNFPVHSGFASAWAADFYEGYFTCDNLDASGATTIYVDFWFRKDDTESFDFTLYYYDGSSYDLIDELDDNGFDDTWLHYTAEITDNQYFVSNFRIRFDATLDFGENVWIDDVLITKEVDQTNYELDLEVQWTNADYDETNEELAIYVNTGNNTHSLDATGGYMIVGDGSPDWGSTTGTISFWIQWDTIADRPWGQHNDMEARVSGTNLVLDWGGTSSLTSSTSFTAGEWYFIAIVWDENTDDLYLYVGDQDTSPAQDAYNSAWTSTVSTLGFTQNNFMASRGGVDPTDGHGEDLRYWNTDRSLPEIQSDYYTELAGSETNLRSYFKLNNNFDDMGPDNNDGSGSGSYSFVSEVPFDAPPTENLRVYIWTGTEWQNVFADLTNGWNNASVSSYLDSSTFTIRFNGDTESSDTTQDSWGIDATLLHVWSSQYTVEVEFTGSSDLEDWSQLTWTVDSAWTTGSVDVTMQLYNFTLGAYPTSGDGYMNYLSSATADTDETQSQTITQNPTQFRNATGHWKVKIRGVKTTDTSFYLKADLVELSPENYQLDMNGPFTIDMSTYQLEDIQGVEMQLRYRADDSAENWYLKAYNWTASTYSDNGFNSTAGHTPTTGWDYYSVNLTDVWQSYVHSNGTINVKLVDSGADSDQTSVDIDFLGVRVEVNGTQFTFRNDGALTIHLVSLWITNSTDHQRYDISIFVNSADTKNYLRTDISLPTGSYSVKVVTERGNTAVYSGS
ncbi:MAG: hypothetical protein JSW14_02390 [Candidatus Bathyarchaeum sp.]|nr:MAG: hypothetical protein JSW14_02390 [Candidatus Bathyarchaeum sp.]